MTDVVPHVLAVVDPGDGRAERAAAVLAGQLGIDVESSPPPTPEDEPDLTDRLEAPGCVLGVVTAPTAPWPLWLFTALQARAPVLVIGPASEGLRAGGLRRVLVPLDGSPATRDAAAGASALLSRQGIDVVPVHVLVPATVPPHLDQAQHGYADLSARLAGEMNPSPPTLRLVRGEVATRILDVARAEAADLIVVAWGQDLSDDRAQVVRHLIERSPAPLLCIPIGAAPVDAVTDEARVPA